jgi:hypothetical protein
LFVPVCAVMTSAETSSIAIHPSQLNASQAVDQIGIKLNSHQVYQNTEQRLESMVPNNGDEMKDSPRDAGFESPLFHHHRPQSCQLYSRRELTWGQVEQQSTEIRDTGPLREALMVADSRDEMNDSGRDGGIESPLYGHRSQSGDQPFVGGKLTWKQVERLYSAPSSEPESLFHLAASNASSSSLQRQFSGPRLISQTIQ